MTPGPTVVDAAWVAARLGLDRKTVYAGAAAGEIPCRRVRRRYLFVREEIEAWLAGARVVT